MNYSKYHIILTDNARTVFVNYSTPKHYDVRLVKNWFEPFFKVSESTSICKPSKLETAIKLCDLVFDLNVSKFNLKDCSDDFYLASDKKVVFQKLTNDIVYDLYRSLNCIRILIKTYLISSRGYFNAHAGCVSINNKGFLIAGKTGSGKSSLILSLLGQKNVKFIANDQVLVFPKKNGSLEAIGFPAIMRFRLGCLNSFFRKKELENKGFINERPENKNRHLYLPNDLRTIVKFEIEPRSKLDFIIFYDKSSKDYELSIKEDSPVEIKKIRQKIEFPLKNAYSRDYNLVSNLSFLSKSYVKPKANFSNNAKIKVFHIRCGTKMLSELSKFLLNQL